MDIITVYFLYGLSFFSMGLAVLLEVGRSSKLDYARALRPLAGFGLVHGTHEWVEMFLIIHSDFTQTFIYDYVGPGRIILLAVSFFFLINFGSRLIGGPASLKLQWRLLGTIAILWLAGLLWVFATQPHNQALIAADVYTRYALAIPGAALTAWGLLLQQRKFNQAGMRKFGRDVVVAALAFGFYGAVGQLFVSPSAIFPSAYLNAPTFQEWFGVPIQLFRSVMACLAAVAMISSLRAFEEENQRHIVALRDAQQAERQRLEELRAALLHRTVRAQEAERQRIARELHDETGQTLTALGLGLRAIAGNAAARPERVADQARQLQALVDEGFTGLQNLISGLHPPQLDDFGLLAAIQWYSREVAERFGLSVEVAGRGDEPELPSDVRVVLYRIVQEALTNISRHAGVNQARVEIVRGAQDLTIRIEDNGHGFDVEAILAHPDHPSWGLLGMLERARLVGGDLRILSEPGEGTLLELTLPIPGDG
jgi:signal transduction histidine kinase